MIPGLIWGADMDSSFKSLKGVEKKSEDYRGPNHELQVPSKDYANSSWPQKGFKNNRHANVYFNAWGIKAMKQYLL